MKNNKITFVFLFVLSISFCGNKVIAQNKKLSLLDYENLSNAKNCYKKGAPFIKKSIDQLIKDANRALTEGPFSVVNKTQIPISGDKHDYLSLGPYWWPDPEKENGLPWIRKDGEVNPLTRGDNVDEPRKDKMFDNTYNLGIAYYFTDDIKYANKAIELLKVWFLNPETKMNPNLNYAQGIPGINNGRGIGIIEFGGIRNIITAIELLEMEQVIDKETLIGLKTWFQDYTFWLETSENGIYENATKNNHGTWYDLQRVSIFMFLDKPEEAKKVLESVKQIRIATQIEKDGKQPHELARTKSLSYSAMNLSAFTTLAYFGKRLNVDLWNYQPENAGGIKDAYIFLYPFVMNSKKWEHQQLGSLDASLDKLKKLFAMAGSIFDVKEYCNISESKKGYLGLGEILFPCRSNLDCKY